MTVSVCGEERTADAVLADLMLAADDAVARVDALARRTAVTVDLIAELTV